MRSSEKVLITLAPSEYGNEQIDTTRVVFDQKLMARAKDNPFGDSRFTFQDGEISWENYLFESNKLGFVDIDLDYQAKTISVSFPQIEHDVMGDLPSDLDTRLSVAHIYRLF